MIDRKKLNKFLDEKIENATSDLLGNLMITLYRDLKLRIKKGHFDKESESE